MAERKKLIFQCTKCKPNFVDAFVLTDGDKTTTIGHTKIHALFYANKLPNFDGITSAEEVADGFIES